MNTFDILSQETSVLGKWFLQASAGTGKTFTIEHLVVRLILEGNLTLDQILVVTFTRVATRELKVRIRANLEKVLEFPHLFPYMKKFGGEEKDKIKAALLLFDQAQIFTIHGFCQKMLQECAFEAGMGLKTEPWTLEEEKREALLFFQKNIINYSRSQKNILLKKFRSDIDSLITALLKAKPFPLKSFEEVRVQISSLFEKLPSFSLIDLFNKEAPHYKKMTNPDFFRQVESLENLFLKKQCSKEDLNQILLEKPYFLEGFESSNLKVKSIEHILDERLAYLRSYFLPLINQLSDGSCILKDLAFHWKKERKNLSILKDKISPDDILEKMRDSLQSPFFIAHVRQKYQAVIVDEFQDTDQLQWQIFEQLFFEKLNTLYFIGDPKQSIYAFRQADIYTFLKVSEKFPSQAYLDTNYRSEPLLVDMLNKLFCHTTWMDLPSLGGTLPVLPVKAGKSGEGLLHFFVAEGNLGRGKKWPSYAMEENYLFPFITQEIQKIHGTCSIVILVKDRYQACRIHAFLQKWNYPSSIQRGESLGESLALSSLQELVRCVVKQDQSLIKKTLLGPLIGWTEEDLTDERLFFAKEKFLNLKAIFKEKGFGAFWGKFLETKWGKLTTIEFLVSYPQLTLYHDLQEIVQKIITQKDPERIYSFLEELKTSETTDRILGEEAGIQIMTIHASKGLEFDVVFALGLASRTVAQDLLDEELKELDAEKMRQLYVAMTRAKQKLYVPLVIDRDSQVLDVGKASPIELFWERVKPILSDYPHTLLNETCFSLSPGLSPEIVVLPPPLALPYFPPAEPILSFSSISKPTHTPIISTQETFPAGVETGIILHRIFERSLRLKDKVEQIVLEEIKGTLLETWAYEILLLVEKTFSLSLLNFSLNDVSINRMQQEMEFTYSTPTSLMKGFIDLWFEKDGKYYILDWKTNLLEDYTQESLEKAMHEGDYFLQASIYTTALKKYIRRFDARPFEECFGGVFYIFVRGPSSFYFNKPLA